MPFPLDNYYVCRYNTITETDITLSVIAAEGEQSMPESTERGALTEAVYYILLSLYSPMHGYAIMQNIKQLSHDRVSLGAGTLYGAINTLVDKGWITGAGEERGSRKKEYVITQSGKEAVKAEIERLKELIQNGENIIGGQ